MENYQYNKMSVAPLRNVRIFAELVQLLVSADRSLPRMGCFFGPSGYGKSQSAIWAVDKHEAIYVECGQYTTAKSLLGDILHDLGVNKPKGTIIDLQNQAIELMYQTPERPLLIDECHYVADRSFINVVGEICRKSGAPVLLIGEETLPQKLERFERVHNYVLDWQPAQPTDQSDFKQLLNVTFADLKISDELGAAILKATGGNTRRICVNLAKAREVAKLNRNETVTLELFGGYGAINVAKSFRPRRARS
jgi:hypothetical protein